MTELDRESGTIALACSVDSDCPTGYVCEAGQCVPMATHALKVDSVPTNIAFTIDGIGAVTAYSQLLAAGSHIIIMPSTIDVGGVTYYFQKWEDNTTNPTRIINLIADVTLTATYATTPPPPPPTVPPLVWPVVAGVAGIFVTLFGLKG